MQKETEKIVGIFQCLSFRYIVKKNINNEYIVERNDSLDIDVTIKNDKDVNLKNGPQVHIVNKSEDKRYDDDDERLQNDFFNDKITAGVYVVQNGQFKHQFDAIDNKQPLCKCIEEMYKDTEINVKRQEYKDAVFLPTQQDRYFLYKNSDNKWTVAQDAQESIKLSPFWNDFNTNDFPESAKLLNKQDYESLQNAISYLDDYYANAFYSLTKDEITTAISQSTNAQHAIKMIDWWIRSKMSLDTNNFQMNINKYNCFMDLMSKIRTITETKQKINKIILPEGERYSNTNYDYFKTLFKTIKENKNDLQRYMAQICSTTSNKSIELSIGEFHKLLYNDDNKKLIVQNKFEHACINAEIDLNKDINKCNNYDKFTINIIGNGGEVQINNNLPKNIHILLDHSSINVYDDRCASVLTLPSNTIATDLTSVPTSKKKNKTSRFITALQNKISQMTMDVNKEDFHLLFKKCLEAIVAITSNHSVSISNNSSKDKTAIQECYYLNGTGPITIRNSNVIGKNNIVSEMKKK